MNATATTAIDAKGLSKSFGGTHALVGVDLSVPKGSVTALLGPNGAGKTTAVRMLTTLLTLDSGSALVAGFDVKKDPQEVRSRIGLTGQFTAVDELLTGRENLELVARLAHIDKARVKTRADDLLKQFDLRDAADRKAGTYSGGMARRLDLAASLITDPEILFLDEPTTGLDPRSRNSMWELIEDLVSQGTTVLLTTQYLDEADQLADSVIVIDHGKVIARGTPDELKDEIGGERLSITLKDGADVQKAASALTAAGAELAVGDDRERIVSALLTDGPLEVARLIKVIDEAGIVMDEVQIVRPTLDDVFLSLTGEHVDQPPPGQ